MFRTATSRDSVLHAIAFVDRIVESTETLLTNSRIGRIVPEFNQQDLREVIAGNYRILYLVKDDSLFIFRIVHGARDLQALVYREPWDIGS
ncbi:MAG: type II toxin-antitoxin system RelE/ParE family toxin [Nitrospiraceae bacterium]